MDLMLLLLVNDWDCYVVKWGKGIVIRYIKCMTSTQELVRIHNDAAGKSWSKYATDIKVGKVN